MKQLTKILLASSSLIIAANSFAASATTNQGFYVGADAGYGITSCSMCSFSLITNTTDSHSSNGIGGTIFGGYQLNSYLAFEAGWGMLPQLEYVVMHRAYTESASVSTSHFYGAIKGMYPINNQWGLFGKVGYDYMTVDSTNLYHTSFSSINPAGVLLAVGGSYSLNENMALTLAYNQILDSETRDNTTLNVNVGYGTIGLTYLF